MYLAPLNYDRFFRKVFSSPKIAKRFLEDFFNIEIESIEILKERHKITDDAILVEFDYRCKVNGQYIIIDMQQWFKIDVGKRFYVYHCINTALQLENLPIKSISVSKTQKRSSKDYSLLEPVITLIWMADDTLGIEESVLTYVLTPDLAINMVQNEELWGKVNFKKLMAERQRILKILGDKTRQLNFLQENKLIYAFQKNIVKDTKTEKYFRWFQFAEKSRNLDNKEEDFKEFLNDDIFMEVISRLDKRTLVGEDFEYITDYEEFYIENQRYIDGLKREFRIELIDEVKEEVALMVREEVKTEVREEVKTEVREEVKTEVREEVKTEVREEVKTEVREEVKTDLIEKWILKKMPLTDIAEFSEIPIEEIRKIALRLGVLN
jgi:uncharacterized protein YhbP (UPF0306 family)